MGHSILEHVTEGLEFRILRNNSGRLLESSRQAMNTALEDLSTAALKKLNQGLWSINRPITRLNQWLCAKREERRKARGGAETEPTLDMEIGRMDGEGMPASGPTTTPPPAETF